VYIAQSSCTSSAMVWAMQMGGGNKRHLIRARKPQSKTLFFKRQIQIFFFFVQVEADLSFPGVTDDERTILEQQLLNERQLV